MSSMTIDRIDLVNNADIGIEKIMYTSNKLFVFFV